jgi:3-hydroxy-9,10-secoandrosta-1,3,5(10)-triene-9,17-dione monooxygenase reductase component
MAEMDTRGLRNVLGCYVTGVAVITTRSANGRHVGVTVNSFSSVSLDPPLILFSLVKTAGVLAHFQQAEQFSVNILSHRQEALSNMFARPSTASWQDVEYTDGEAGCALVAGCVAHLECRRHSEIDGGDHRIFLASVTGFHLQRAEDPLVFYRGRYGTYVRDKWSSAPPSNSSLTEFAANDLMIPGWG